MPKYIKDRSARLNMRITPHFKRQLLFAAAMDRVTLTDWVEAALQEALKRQLEKAGRTNS